MNSNMLVATIKFMKEKHEGQTRIGGEPYYTHPLRVAEILEYKGYDESYQAVGLLHDVLEDTDALESEVEYYGYMFTQDAPEAVKLLTKYDCYNMKDYITGIKSNKIAHIVKLADRLHNLQCAVVANDKFKRKYIDETKEWYLDLSKGTDFEGDIIVALRKLEESLEDK